MRVDFDELQEYPDASRTFARNRKAIAFLSSLGLMNSAYLYLFQTGRIKHLWCPCFGNSCESIVSSPLAYQGKIPDSLLGAIGYSVLLGFALAGDEHRHGNQRILPILMGGCSFTALGLSALLVYVQKKEFDDYCLWCLASAAISSLTVPLALPEFLEALRAPKPVSASPSSFR